MSTPRVWLVTGASSGFGHAMVRFALSHGEKVVATLRKPSVLAELASQYPSSQLIVVKLDVSNHEEIKDAFRKAKKAFGRVDIVFNNAGYGVLGEAEGTPDDRARPMFDVNFWGAAHVSQEAVRFFREENQPQGGHLVQNSATTGFASHPIMAFYGASKHALEAFSETLQQELNPAWNINVTIVEPGAFYTEIVDAIQFVPQHPAYAYPSSATSTRRKLFTEDVRTLPFSDVDKGVQKIFELTQLASPPLHLPLGKDAVANMRLRSTELTKTVEEYASWSENLERNRE